MSRITSAACPLSDCTLAVDNAENIRNSKDAALSGLKAAAATATAVRSTPRQRALLRNVKAMNRSAAAAAAEMITPPARHERVSGATRTSSATPVTAVVTADAVVPLSSTSAAFSSPLMSFHIFAKPFTPGPTWHRNDPYAPCLLKSTCTPEDSFYACYCEMEETPAVLAVNLTNTPIRPHAVSQAAALPAQTQALLQLLSKPAASSSLCLSPMTTPMKESDSAEQSPASLAAGGGLTTTPSLASTPERIASPPSRQPPTTSARVIRKVVSCGVDRTSGRPVPKPKE
ncbi:hypothetical protein LSCM1_02296 [Leishmania martiniquensis]|uniref:Uncharacterized protein n=1 Tax=Leishmania martiniquensis TaxID=1580590 RepID=A0A836G5C7_9TRYP|nr:hypothetical protein LSCM1_02296 [Leishmania martiniquensis]